MPENKSRQSYLGVTGVSEFHSLRDIFSCNLNHYSILASPFSFLSEPHEEQAQYEQLRDTMGHHRFDKKGVCEHRPKKLVQWMHLALHTYAEKALQHRCPNDKEEPRRHGPRSQKPTHGKCRGNLNMSLQQSPAVSHRQAHHFRAHNCNHKRCGRCMGGQTFVDEPAAICGLR